jgi:hypothetical protein
MIQPQELRIGNILNYTTAENDILPTTIDWQDLKWISEDQKGFNLVHHPIALTEEWLLKFGFHKKGLWYKKDDAFIIGWIDNKSQISVGVNRNYSITYRYVHQLQNLYFALTKKELKIN